MKIFHLSDLHIGKQLHLYDMSDVQRRVLKEIVACAKEKRPDAILISGDIYDKSAPSGDAFMIFDEFLNDISSLEPQIPVLIISGNHDSNQRLSYASSFMNKHNIYIAAMPPQNEADKLKKIVLNDEYGSVNFYMLPFVRVADAKNLFGDTKEIRTYDDAVAAILEREAIDYSQRNVLLAHQFFVSGSDTPKRCDSEVNYISVGGIDSVDIRHVSDFDYVALGHIHTSQKVGEGKIRYCGSPIKYSVSEANGDKSITVVNLGPKDSELSIDTIPLIMKPDIKVLKGTLDEVIAMSNEELKNDFVSIVLTDRAGLFRPKDRLRDFYNNILEISIEGLRDGVLKSEETDDFFDRDILTMFCDFYEEMNREPVGEEEKNVISEVITNCMDTK